VRMINDIAKVRMNDLRGVYRRTAPAGKRAKRG
jgi:hypothetical protein